MEIYKSVIKKTLIEELIKRLSLNSNWNKDECIKFKEYDKDFDEIVNQLCNLSLKEIVNLDEKQTYIVRKRLGLYDNGKFLTYKEIAKDTNLSLDNVRIRIINSYRKIWKTAIHEYNIITNENLKLLTKEELLETDIEFIDEFSSSLKFNLHRYGIYTIGDLTLHDKEQMKNIPQIGDMSVEKIASFLNNFGLNFLSKEDNADLDEKPIQILSKEPSILFDENKKEVLRKYKSLILKKEQLERRITKLDFEIEELEKIIKDEKINEKSMVK